MKKHIEEVFKLIISTTNEDTVQADVDDLKGDYVDDWEDEFDDVYEAYAEQGRGEAEHEVLNGLIREHAPDFSLDDHSVLFDALAEHYCLNTN